MNAVEKKPVTKGKKLMGKAAGIVVGVPTVVTLGALALRNYFKKSKSGSKLPSGEPVLTPDNAQSLILSNVSGHNSSKQTVKIIEESSGIATLPRIFEATPQEHQALGFVIKHSRLNTKRKHTSKQTIVYIVVIVVTALLFIVAGVFVLMQQVKTKNEDLCIDMNQYYANDLTKANSTMHTIYPNVSLKQRNHLI